MRMEVMLCPQNELLFWQRFAVQPPLGVLNAVLAQPVALAFGFHPFGDGGQIERFGHFNNVRRQRPVLEGIDKRFIDFQRVDVQFLQIAQAGVARYRNRQSRSDGQPDGSERSPAWWSPGRQTRAR